MKHLISRQNIELLIEQAIFSIFNFCVIIGLYSQLTTLEIAAIGVNITALYAILSICRNLISGQFTQSGLPVDTINFAWILRIITLRSLSLSPIQLLLMYISCKLTKIDFFTTVLLLTVTFQVILVDNFRQIQVLFQKTNLMLFFLIISIVIACAAFYFTHASANKFLFFWIYFLTSYLVMTLLKFRNAFLHANRQEISNFDLVSRKLITLESFLNHSLFYLYSFLFFHYNPWLSGQIRLIGSWVVNSASTLYFTINNHYAIKLVNHKSNRKEQKSINVLSFASLALSSLLFVRFNKILPLGEYELNIWLIFGTCVSSATFFIHSRVSILNLHRMTRSSFLTSTFVTWLFVLVTQLVLTGLLGSRGFIIGSLISLFFAFKYYERALKLSSLPSD